jgi:hypothetical protein
MTSPGYTADASFATASTAYRARLSSPFPSDRFTPAQRLDSTCGPCSCDAGKCCELTLFGCGCKICGAPETSSRAPTLLRA